MKDASIPGYVAGLSITELGALRAAVEARLSYSDHDLANWLATQQPADLEAMHAAVGRVRDNLSRTGPGAGMVPCL